MTNKLSKRDQEALLRKEHAIRTLRAILPPGTTIYLIKKSHTAKIEFTIFAALLPVNGEIANITRQIAYATGAAYRGWGAISTRCVDTLLNNLSWILHGDKDVGVQNRIAPNKDNYKAGYSLIHRWL